MILLYSIKKLKKTVTKMIYLRLNILKEIVKQIREELMKKKIHFNSTNIYIAVHNNSACYSI